MKALRREPCKEWTRLCLLEPREPKSMAASPTYAGYRLGRIADPRFEALIGGRSTGDDVVSTRDLKGLKWGPDPLLDTSDQTEYGIA